MNRPDNASNNLTAQKEYDVIIVGSGAGGSTVAREMAKKGKKVLLLEKGGRTEIMGSTITTAMMIDIWTLLRNYRDLVIFVNNYGGASNISAGSAMAPPKSVFDPVGIDLTAEAKEAKKEMKIQEQPDELIGDTNMRLLEAANSLGYKWEKVEKFIDPQKCTMLGNCMLGCKEGAKWTARVFGDEAVANGADLSLNSNIKKLLVENNNVIGVEGTRWGKKVKYYGKSVVLSAGGLTNVNLLRKAGIDQAGEGLCCDWLQFVQGIIPGINSIGAPPMSVGSSEFHDEDGIVLMPVGPNWALFLGIAALTGVKDLFKFKNFFNYTSIMVKVKDETVGKIGWGNKFEKPLTETDRKKLDKGVDVIKKILVKAGASEDSIYPMRPAGAHPSATCRIGHVLDNNFETEIKNLFCCDASILPSSLGAPVVWTAVSLGKKLSKHLITRL